jgi:hypothetical protein
VGDSKDSAPGHVAHLKVHSIAQCVRRSRKLAQRWRASSSESPGLRGFFRKRSEVQAWPDICLFVARVRRFSL